MGLPVQTWRHHSSPGVRVTVMGLSVPTWMHHSSPGGRVTVMGLSVPTWGHHSSPGGRETASLHRQVVAAGGGAAAPITTHCSLYRDFLDAFAPCVKNSSFHRPHRLRIEIHVYDLFLVIFNSIITILNKS